MGFKDDYTTKEILDVEVLIDKNSKEKYKMVVSNDTYAIGQLLECLINKMVK